MAYWLVSGRIKVELECGCEFCSGHDPKYKNLINVEIETETPEEAAERVLIREAEYVAGSHEVDEAEWVGQPAVKELPTDQVLRRLGAPMLFDVPPESLGHTAWVEPKR